jgi:hypothetical protein
MVGCMVVMPRERWTDEKLDKAFGRIDGDLRELRVEMRKGFEQVDQRFDQVDKRFEQVDKRFDRLEDSFGRLEIWFGTLCCTIIGGLIAGLLLH